MIEEASKEWGAFCRTVWISGSVAMFVFYWVGRFALQAFVKEAP